MLALVISMIASSAVGQFSPLHHVASLDEQMKSPTQVAIAPDNSIYVADPGARQILKFLPDWTLANAWTLPQTPVGIAAHPDGRFFVSLLETSAVGIYDGAFQQVGLLGSLNPLVTYARPAAIDIAADTGIIYVVDSLGDRVYGFESDGSLSLILGGHGEGNSEFQYPTAIGVDETNARIIVADQDNFRIQIFTLQGVFVKRFGYINKFLSTGEQEGWMPRTLGVAVDATGNIYVADALMSTVRVFDSGGSELVKVLGFGSSVGELRTPCGIALSNDGLQLFVTNVNQGRVDVFDAPMLGAMQGAPGDHLSGVDGGVAGTNWNRYDADRRSMDRVSSRRITGKVHRAESVRDPVPSSDTVLSAEINATQDTTEYDGPHMIDATIVCGRCHGINDQPGGHVGLTEGQTLLCLSCHNMGGQAMTAPLNEMDIVDGNPEPGRSHKWGVSAIDATHGSVGPTPGSVMSQYLGAGGTMKCATCHDQHSQRLDSAYLRVRNVDGALCLECHADAVTHTPAGPWQPECTQCHFPHDSASVNLSLIGSSIFNQTLAISRPVTFVARSGPGSFSDGDPAANDGICQVCHTTTTYHRYDGSGMTHNEGLTCTDCHPHDAGFLPTGGSCTGCHASPQDNGDGLPVGGRRAVVGEFPTGDAHAHYGTELDDATCVICHDQTTHMDGRVDLLDADSGELYTFVTADQLTSDPDLSDFCSSCHDSDGATRLATPLDPFGNGNPPQDVASRFLGTLQWDQMYSDFCFGPEGTLRGVNSHHDISDADQAYSGAKIECLDCHGSHGAGGSQPIVEPFNTLAPWSGSSSAFCLECHSGGMGPLDPAFPPGVVGPSIDPSDPRWDVMGMDWTTILGGACLAQECSSLRGLDSCDNVEGPWYVDYSWTHSTHGPSSKRGWMGYSGAASADIDCLVCHDPHGSWTPTNPSGNPYMIRDEVDGSPFVDDGVRTLGFNGPPFNTMGTLRTVEVSASGTEVVWGGPTGLCDACHADWLAAYDFHGVCNSCQTCHGHGMLWTETDWVDFNDDTPCPVTPAPGAATRPGAVGWNGSAVEWPAKDVVPPLHQKVVSPSHNR